MLIWNANTNKVYCICAIQDSSKLKRCLIRSNKIHIPWNSVSFIWLSLFVKNLIRNKLSHVTRQTLKWSCYDQDVIQKQLITWPTMREEETGNPAATLSPVKISTILESNQPTSFLFCFKNCLSVSAEGLKRPTWTVCAVFLRTESLLDFSTTLPPE